MDVFKEALGKVNQMRLAVNASIQKAFDDNNLIVKDIQVNKQLFDKGENAKGSIIRPAYTPITISLKKAKGQPTDRVTLKDTGVFYFSIDIIANDTELVIESSLSYSKYLIDKYGDDILGIQEDFLKEFLEKYTLLELKKQFDDIISNT